MYEKLLIETEKFLIEQEEKEIPILDLWQAMIKHAKKCRYEIPTQIRDFECLLEADKRFIFIKPDIQLPEIDFGEDEGNYEVGEDYFEVEEIEKIGFDERVLVGLSSKIDDNSDSYGENTDEGNFAPRSSSAREKSSENRNSAKLVLKKQTAAKKKPAAKRKK